MNKPLKIISVCLLGIVSFTSAFLTSFFLRNNKRNTPLFDVEKDGYVEIMTCQNRKRYSLCFDSSMKKSMHVENFESDDFDVCYFNPEKDEHSLLDAHGKVMESDEKTREIMMLCREEYKTNRSFGEVFDIYRSDTHYIVSNFLRNAEGMEIFFYENDAWIHPLGMFPGQFIVGLRYLK